MDGRVEFIKLQLASSLSRSWTVEEMAAAVRLSPAHFHRLFRQTVGVPPMRYLQDLRLDTARQLLETTFLQVKEIGHLTGLRDASHLCISFKARFGTNPLEHRKHFWRPTVEANK